MRLTTKDRSWLLALKVDPGAPGRTVYEWVHILRTQKYELEIENQRLMIEQKQDKDLLAKAIESAATWHKLADKWRGMFLGMAWMTAGALVAGIVLVVKR